jgi:thiamine kinase-like enzyme
MRQQLIFPKMNLHKSTKTMGNSRSAGVSETNFGLLSGNEHRAIYEHSSMYSGQRINYIAKVFPLYEKEMKSKNEKTGPEMELKIYNTIKSSSICPVVYTCKKTPKCKHFIPINDDEDIELDFTDWWFELDDDCKTFSVIVVRKYLTYDIIDNIVDFCSTQELEHIFIRIMKDLHVLNLKYAFIHGDLKTDNVIVNKKGDIKLIDFDASRLGKYYSENTNYHDNSEFLENMTPDTGFMYDFYRLYCSIYLWDNKDMFDSYKYNPIIKSLNEILDRVIEVYEKNEIPTYKTKIFNDALYFGEWMMFIKHEDVIDFIYYYP